ncbi:MAG: thiol:disulfide interchange protein DsbA/DsbL [Pseudomonadota bacterium]
MKKWFLAAFLAVMPVLASALVPVEGKDYKVLANPTVAPPKGQVEVAEFFWYGCPHCYTLEPHVAAWLKTKPANVKFSRIPAALNPVWEANARGYYVAEASGVLEASHAALFDAIQVRKERLFDQASLAAFYARYGVKAQSFNGLYQSFAVSARIAQSRNLAVRYQLSGVPAMVVNGKYLVTGDSGRVMEVVQALIVRERAAK